MPLPYKRNQSVIHFLRMTRTQEMRPALHNNQIRSWSVGEHLNLLLCIRNRVHRVIGPLPFSSALPSSKHAPSPDHE
jgi:hypothetical protein